MKHLAIPLILILSACDTQFATRDANIRTTFNFKEFSTLWDAKVQERITLELELQDPNTTDERRAIIETTIAIQREMLNNVITQAIVTLSTSYTIEIHAPNLTAPPAGTSSPTSTHPSVRPQVDSNQK